MANMKELLSESLEKDSSKQVDEEISFLKGEIRRKKGELDDLCLKSRTVRNLKNERSFFVDKIGTGLVLSVHRKGSEVRLFPSGDISAFFKDSESNEVDLSAFEAFQVKVKEQVLRLSDKDFILDCELVRDKRDLFLYVVDMPFFGECVSDMPLGKRKRLIEKLAFTDNVKEVPSVLAVGKVDLEKAVDLVGKFDGCRGVLVRRFGSPYIINKDSNSSVVLLFSKE